MIVPFIFIYLFISITYVPLSRAIVYRHMFPICIVPFILYGAGYLLGRGRTTTDHARNCCTIYVVPSIQVRLGFGTLWGLFVEICACHLGDDMVPTTSGVNKCECNLSPFATQDN